MIDRLLEKLNYLTLSLEYYQKKYNRTKSFYKEKEDFLKSEGQGKVSVMMKEHQSLQKSNEEKEAKIKKLQRDLEDAQNNNSLLKTINNQFKETAEKSDRKYRQLEKKYVTTLEALQEREYKLRILEEECPNYHNILGDQKLEILQEKGLQDTINDLANELKSMKIEMKTLNEKFTRK